MTTLALVILRDTTVNKPAAGVPGRLFYDTTLNKWERDTGAVWEDCEPATFDASDITYTPNVLADWDSGADPGNIDAAADQLAERVADLEGAGSPDASVVTYTPADNSKWTGNADPGNADDALDQLVSRLKTEEGHSHAAPDASVVTFTPADNSKWSGSADPGDTDDALNQLASRLTTEEGHGHDAAAITFTPAVATDWDSDADPGNTDDALDQLAERVDDLEGSAGSGDAANITYTPAMNTDWDSDADPGNIDDALDQLAERVDDLEGASAASHNLLSAVHSDSTAAAAQRGDLITAQGASPLWTRLAKGVQGQHLNMGADESQWADDLKYPGVSFDNGASAIAVNTKRYLYLPYACEVLQWTIVGAPAGDIVIDVWACSYANFDITTHPVDGDALPGAGHEPTVAATNPKGQATATGTWHTVAIAAGTVLCFNVDSCTTMTTAQLVLKVKLTA